MDETGESLSRTALWNYRRAVAGIYSRVRAIDDPRRAWELWRAERERLFRDHPASALAPSARASFRGLRYHAYDPAFRFRVTLDAAAGPEVRLDLGADGRASLVPFARTRGLDGPLGAELTLYWFSGYGGGVFLPFRDATNGGETYGGGRYLLDTIKGADLGLAEDRTVLDFNFAYNPSCAYDRRWPCPLAPSANALPGPVRAGEKIPAAASDGANR